MKPTAITRRYLWLEPQVREVAEGFERISNADDTAWLLLVSDYAGSTPSAYAWNEWERLSLAAASGDAAWQGRIRAFWDDHFPIVTSVKSGYAYFAVQRDGGAVVVGEEPEFEETSLVASDYSEFLGKLAAYEPSILRWL